jgi:hypothetical protein
MYLHIGEEKEVLITKIIGIFDIKANDHMLLNHKHQINVISNEKAKSIIIVEENNEYCIYLSPISAMTLSKRWNKT